MTSIILGVLLLAAIGALIYRERENAKERATLADRIQAPAAAQIAAMDRVWEPMPLPEGADESAPEPLRHHDLTIEALLEDR